MTRGLSRSEEVVFVAAASNPGLKTVEIGERYSVSGGRAGELLDSLVESGYLRPLPEGEHGDLKWRVTDKGRVLLKRMVYNARFDILEARIDDKPVAELVAKKKVFEQASEKAEGLFGEGGGGR